MAVQKSTVRNIIAWLPLFSLLLAASLQGQDSNSVFRNSFRPTHTDTITVEELAKLQAIDSVVLLDVRLEEDFEKDIKVIPGAQHLNPEAMPSWVHTIDSSKVVIVYCVAGKWVSQKIAHQLEQSGITAYTLIGGLDAWNNSQGGKAQ